MVSDGLVIEDNRAFGWVLSTCNGTQLATCSQPAYGCTVGGSFCAEAYGVLPWMTFLLQITKFFSIHLLTTKEIQQQLHPYLQAFTYNLGVIQQVQIQLLSKCIHPRFKLLLTGMQ